jgi:beta-phosphoglucomutase-like phosphatase (HAD superfamily)
MAAFKQHGFGHITREEHELGPIYGSSHTDILGGVLHAADAIDKSVPFHLNQTVLDVIDTKAKLFKEAAEAGFDEMPGAVKFVALIAPHFQGRMSIVTSSEEEFIHPFLERYDLAQYFADELLIGHETVMAEGLEVKPAGDPYQLAMRRMSAKRLLVFEDTVSGTAAGKRAGATVVALGFDKHNRALFHEGNLEYPPDVIVENYDEAAAILGLV